MVYGRGEVEEKELMREFEERRKVEETGVKRKGDFRSGWMEKWKRW